MHDLLVSYPRQESQDRNPQRQRAPVDSPRIGAHQVTAIPSRVGDTILQRTSTGQMRRVKVTARDPDIKNGRPGFDGQTDTALEWGVWGYDDQVVRVVR